jgi:hypothetical protein
MIRTGEANGQVEEQIVGQATGKLWACRGASRRARPKNFPLKGLQQRKLFRLSGKRCPGAEKTLPIALGLQQMQRKFAVLVTLEKIFDIHTAAKLRQEMNVARIRISRSLDA